MVIITFIWNIFLNLWVQTWFSGVLQVYNLKPSEFLFPAVISILFS